MPPRPFLKHGSRNCHACAVRPGGVRGFTIIELMIAVAILAILVTIAAPSLSDLVRDQRVKTSTFDVFASLTFARSEAIKRNANVDIVPTGADWALGWRVQVQSDSTVLKRQDPLTAMSITGPAGTITYRRDGRLDGVTAPTFVVKSAESATITARCVRVDLSGRPNIKVDTNKDASDGCQ